MNYFAWAILLQSSEYTQSMSKKISLEDGDGIGIRKLLWRWGKTTDEKDDFQTQMVGLLKDPFMPHSITQPVEMHLSSIACSSLSRSS